jgi:hypothetical protein
MHARERRRRGARGPDRSASREYGSVYADPKTHRPGRPRRGSSEGCTSTRANHAHRISDLPEDMSACVSPRLRVRASAPSSRRGGVMIAKPGRDRRFFGACPEPAFPRTAQMDEGGSAAGRGPTWPCGIAALWHVRRLTRGRRTGVREGRGSAGCTTNGFPPVPGTLATESSALTPLESNGTALRAIAEGTTALSKTSVRVESGVADERLPRATDTPPRSTGTNPERRW